MSAPPLKTIRTDCLSSFKKILYGNKKSHLTIGFFSIGASVLTGLNEKCSKIKGFRQSINGINLKIKYFSFQNTLRY